MGWGQQMDSGTGRGGMVEHQGILRMEVGIRMRRREYQRSPRDFEDGGRNQNEKKGRLKIKGF